MTLHVHESVGSIFKMLLGVSHGQKLYALNFGSLLQCSRTLFNYTLNTCLAVENTPGVSYFLSESASDESSSRKQRLKVFIDPRIELYHPTEQFHYGFSLPPFDSNGMEVLSIQAQDPMQLWECSKVTTANRNGQAAERSAPQHVIAVEAMFNATMYGGYFAAVLPKNWLGNRMKFMRWFANRAAPVARIALPFGTVYDDDKEPVGDWYLYIWNKPIPEDHKQAKKLDHAIFRWSTFIYQLPDTSEAAVEKLFRVFRKHDWWQNSVELWKEFLAGNYNDHDYGAGYKALDLEDPSKIRIFQPGEQAKLVYTIINSLEEMNEPNMVQIKPGPPVKLSAASSVARVALLDIESEIGLEYDPKANKPVSRLDLLLKQNNFTAIQDTLLAALQEHSLRPVILSGDVKRIQKQDRWLERQLTPIERSIKIQVDQVDDGNGDAVASSAVANDIGAVWEKLFEDVGMRANQAEVMAQWEQRGKKMSTDGMAYEFQFGDIVVMCCKNGVLNSNVMGLGKTLETLLTFLMRTSKKGLFIVPASLIGEWQEQIEKELSLYARRVRRNWRGEPVRTDYQVIEWAKDCRREHLKTINLISYEKIWAVPRDASYFVCPHCQRVVCSPSGAPKQVCPGNWQDLDDPLNDKCIPIRKWRRENKEKKLRVHVYNVNPSSPASGVKLYHRVWRKVEGEAFPQIEHQKLRKVCTKLGLEYGFPSDWKLVDPRPPRPMPRYMELSDRKFKKVMKKQTSMMEEKIVHGVKTEVPVYKYIDRTPHVKWSFSELLRNSFNFVAIDEALRIKNEATNRAQALWHITSRTRYANTGTPLRGLPQNILNIINWVTKRPVYSEYRMNDKGSLGRFLAKYGTYATDRESGNRKLLPKINQAELFQSELAPIMLRHIRNEPLVRKDISQKIIRMQEHAVLLDESHKKFYQLWLEKFAEWWAEKRKYEDGQENAKVSNDLLAKITYLINASSIPHWMFDNLTSQKNTGKLSESQRRERAEFATWAAVIGKYKGPATAKQKQALRIILAARKRGDKCLVASTRRKNLEFGRDWCEKNGLAAMKLDGSVSNNIKKGSNRSLRQEMINAFRLQDYWVAWCGLTALSEGANIPEANHGILLDYSWSPDEYRQFIGRMIRPQQQKVIYEEHLYHVGTIEEYMMMWNFLKASSADEAIDYMEFDMTTEMIPDIRMYADSIVDRTEAKLNSRMRLAVDRLKRKREAGEDDE